MRARHREWVRKGRAAEWETERAYAAPAVFPMVVMVGVTSAAFVALAAGAESIGWGWFQVPLALAVAVYLIQGLPSEVVEEEGASTLALSLSLWSARAILLVVLFGLYFAVVDAQDGVSSWPRLVTVAFAVMPLIWFALLQLRQFGLLAVLGIFPPRLLSLVGGIVLSQVALWSTTALSWLEGGGRFFLLSMIAMALAWHGVGNICLGVLRIRSSRSDP